MRGTNLNCRSIKVKKTKQCMLSHYFLFLFPGISTFTTKVFRTRMCFMCRTLLMELPPYSLTRINSLKMALWHWRVSHTAEHIHCTFYCVQTHTSVLNPSFFTFSLCPSSGSSVRGVWIFCIWSEQQWVRLGNSAFHEGWWPHLPAWCTGEG